MRRTPATEKPGVTLGAKGRTPSAIVLLKSVASSALPGVIVGVAVKVRVRLVCVEEVEVLMTLLEAEILVVRVVEARDSSS
jgi:hypothetical protein